GVWPLLLQQPYDRVTANEVADPHVGNDQDGRVRHMFLAPRRELNISSVLPRRLRLAGAEGPLTRPFEPVQCAQARPDGRLATLRYSTREVARVHALGQREPSSGGEGS